ncbi:MAG: type 4a pilus biogenesis protein PilO, partial [Gammaproteobacteria bacterium]
WPGWFVIVMALLGCLLFAYGGWHFVLGDQRLTLESAGKKEIELKQAFSTKKGMVVNLPAYKAQMVEIEELLAEMLQKLPDSTEVPSLLVDITEAGTRRGLEFSVFDPQAQKLEAFYTSLPIRVEVRGSYHQIANFVSDLARMSRIVTVGDLSLVGEEDGEVKASLMLQTYSYLPEGV